jgi:hypothetical protein
VLLGAKRTTDLPKPGEQHFVSDGSGGWLEVRGATGDREGRAAWFHAVALEPGEVVDRWEPGRGGALAFEVLRVERA